ncbi:MAG: D-inositol-3-phosphate glycosyltransferase [Acidimicrobiaceae bacterium]|jgi:D-inositol-3-phosphate glycosyltransferase|nr:D-inositol-3-phosphate glycosyltransferase [Acidimicrobiaceae bacterium]MDQ1445149.1 D-inositol-3-phosphate glycosyltransferase [Acidimicrobiaceae bacterium]
MRHLAVLSMHTSPLAQPGLGDGGGMNVYVRELSAALARSGVECDVYTRAWSPELPATVPVEPGFRVHHVPAGPLAPVAKEDLPELVDEFAEAVVGRIEGGRRAEVLHANYWLSGVAGHRIKHELDLPLVATFHTLARVKAEASEDEPLRREQAEASVMGCADTVLASCSVEAHQIASLYGVDAERIEIVPPGVERAFFAPGYRPQARRALGLPADRPMLLFVGRVQPLKALDVAVQALADSSHKDAFLVAVGGPSGVQGQAEADRIRALVADLGLSDRVFFRPPQPHELLSTFYRAADVCIVPSRSESFGLVALEAAACGTPVVAAAVGGLRTLVDHGRTGFLVERRDPATFALYVDEVLGNPMLAAQLSADAAERARQYVWPVAAARLRGLYAELTDRSLVECR